MRHADGRVDTDSRVVWLQTPAGMADMRVRADRPDLRGRAGLEACGHADLLALAEQDAMCGQTLFDPRAQPYPTATWPADAALFRYQPVTAFPEPGWLAWSDDGARMTERAPSGAYEEEWVLEPESRSRFAHLERSEGAVRQALFVAGGHAVYARSRAAPVAERRRLPDLARAAGGDLARLRALLDCEFSYARRQPDGGFVIVLSTLPWREGATLDCAWAADSLR